MKSHYSVFYFSSLPSNFEKCILNLWGQTLALQLKNGSIKLINLYKCYENVTFKYKLAD